METDSDLNSEVRNNCNTDCLYENGFENSNCFLSIWNENVGEFLKRDEYVSVRGTALSNEDLEAVDIVPDVDGISIRWKKIEGLSLDFDHLFIEPNPRQLYSGIRPLYGNVKKHLDLRKYGENGMRNLRNSVGYKLTHYNGWEVWLAFVPKSSTSEYLTLQSQRNVTVELLTQVRLELQTELQELCGKRIASRTLAKNNLTHIRSLFVLPGDQRHILCAIDRAIERAVEKSLSTAFEPLLLTFRFGEKCRTNVDLPIRHRDYVLDICTHIGLTISNAFTDMFWSRDGINNIIGRKGQLSCVQSMFECLNFQSNLDHRSLDVKAELLEICRFPGNVRFVQVYTDLPHRRPKTIVHPVSASVIFTSGILSAESRRKVTNNASEYIIEVQNNFKQMNKSECRMEFVIVLSEIPETIIPGDFVVIENLYKLLQNNAMIVAFDVEDNVVRCVRKVGLYLCDELIEIFDTRKGTGDHDAVWVAYQYECAVEKLLWGSPLCHASNQYSINLGVGLSYPTRSLTDGRGFLCLEESNSCCVDDSTTPPLCVYTSNSTVQKKIKRTFGLFNMKEAIPQVLGKRLILCLLHDLYDIGNVFVGFEDFLLMLKRSPLQSRKKIVGGITVKDLSNKLGSFNKCRKEMVFGGLRKLLSLENQAFIDTLEKGILALELDYFPAVCNYDRSRNESMDWSYTYGVWVLLDSFTETETCEREAESLYTLVLCKLEKDKVCHTSQYHNCVFPWITPVLKKTAEKKLSTDQKVHLLAYISGVALLMNGSYVDYLNLSRLERNLPISQVMLRMMEVLCKSRVASVNTANICRLHPSISHTLNLEKKRKVGDATTKQTLSERPGKERDTEELSGMNTTDSPSLVADQCEVVQSRHVSFDQCTNSNFRWTDEEMKILKEVQQECSNCGKNSLVQKFRTYQKKCRDKGFKDRTVSAFRLKLLRLKN